MTQVAECPAPSAAAPATVTWAELGLGPDLLSALAKAKFETPTDIQREMIPHALRGADVIGQAKTGTGKTAAFALPMIERLKSGGGLQGLVLVPTRELALQVDEHVRMLGVNHPLKTALILGGRNIRQQITQLRHNPEIVVGTPGRVLDLLQRKELSFDGITLVVLDEIDRMLDIGFRDDIRRILKVVRGEHQTIFVSATIDDEIRKLARTFMREPLEVNVSADVLTVESIVQGFVALDPRDKYPTLLGLLHHEKPTLAIVFTNTKHQARRVAQHLKKDGVNCKEIHGDLMQSRRERVMQSFRAARIQVLVATDLASRGLDVMEISHIVNYDVPEDTAVYVHRVGRTARMGNTGYAVTFITREQGKLLTDIEKLINKELPQWSPPWLIRREPLPAGPDVEPIVPATEPGAAGAEGAVAAAPDAGPPVPTRFREAVRRCQILDSHGLKPVERTLGSRFRSPRKFRR